MKQSEKRTRRLGGWGFEGEDFEPSEQLLTWLTKRVGPAGPPLRGDKIPIPDLKPRALPEIPLEVTFDSRDRLFHARGQGLPDIIRLRTGTVNAVPDGIVRPSNSREVEAVLAACRGRGIRIVPWGGGTSVTGGVNRPSGDESVLCMELERMADLVDLDTASGLAVFGPGTTGPKVELSLAEHGFTLGHFPQSWELATVGGWVATRSSGQESLGYGRIEDMVAGLEVVSPSGRLHLPTLPASAAGPDLRQLIMGSEGRLGIITQATLRVRPRPQLTNVDAYLVPNINRGLDAVRDLVWAGIPLSMARLSDPQETTVAMAIGLGSSSFAPLVQGYLRLRGIRNDGCMMLVGANGRPEIVGDTLAGARSILSTHRAVSLGRRPGRHWLRDRFRHPYLREALLDRGWATDTLETAVPWSKTLATREKVVSALENALSGENERAAVLCHISHPYIDGTSLYFTFFFRCASDTDATISRWAQLKRAASEALVNCGATITHHHGIGVWHAPWLKAETGELGLEMLSAAVQRMDPERILNPEVLLDPTDRLEV
ncbi:MAG: FAD-binding oxidoreductase [Thermoanaerobaculales bacterium]|nr:FAD-binding oxidoreductase [Thermoanaerobaculales bacterium]